MYKLTATNVSDSTFIDFNEGVFTIDSIEGLSPPEATINLTQMALVDGQLYNSAHITYRTINLAFAIEVNAERNRLLVYSVFRTKDLVRLHYRSPWRDVYIDGYVASVSIDHFAMKQIATVSIICPSPWWYSEEDETTLGSSVTVNNAGELNTGCAISIEVGDDIEDIIIANTTTSEAMTLTYEFEADDVIEISTVKGSKTATLTRDSAVTNLLGYISGSWVSLDSGDNTITLSVTTGDVSDLDATMTVIPLYEGV